MKHAARTLKGQNGTKLYCQRWCPENTPRAVLAVVHGFGEHSGRYGNVVDWFVPKGYAVYVLDLPGHGRSGGQRGYIDRFADFRGDVKVLLTLVRNENPETPIFLLGHSLGGLIVLNYALSDPEGLAGIIASGPFLSSSGISSPLAIQLVLFLSKILPRLPLPAPLDSDFLSRDPEVVEAYRNDPLVHGRVTPRLAAEVLTAIDWTQAHAADLNLPCLIVHGGDDQLSPPEASKVFFENVTFADKQRYEYAGYYHEVFNDLGKEQVLADVEAWLARHLEQG